VIVSRTCGGRQGNAVLVGCRTLSAGGHAAAAASAVPAADQSPDEAGGGVDDARLHSGRLSRDVGGACVEVAAGVTVRHTRYVPHRKAQNPPYGMEGRAGHHC
jgi:hypothetical protein